jgi:hypothetical protein
MLKIDNSLLQEVGLGSLPDAEKNSLLKHIYETLEMRVGIRLADQMSNEQLDEFERYFEAKDDAGAFKWLETNFPNYKEIVQQEFDKLKAEVAQSAPQILSASQAQAAQGPIQPAMAGAVPVPLAAAPPPMPPSMPPAPPLPPSPSAPAGPESAPSFGPQPFTPQPAPPTFDPQPPVQPQPYAAPPMLPSVPPPMPPAQGQPPYPSQQPPAGPFVQ